MTIQQIAVIGSGTMGQGIAYVAAVAGFDVRLFDKEAAQLSQAQSLISSWLQRESEKKRLEEPVHTIAARLKYVNELEVAAVDADFVIEAVPEILDVKLGVFRALDRMCSAHTVLATNTSTMSPTEMGASTKRANQTIAMHFFNPVPRMKLVEIVRGLDTSDETYERTRQVAERMGKQTVCVNEFPGFITSRMNCLIGNEAMLMVQEGVASVEDIDKAVKLGLNFPMGPLELADLVGLDARLRNMQYLHLKLGEKFRPAPILEKYVQSGRLGRKTREGFYKYET